MLFKAACLALAAACLAAGPLPASARGAHRKADSAQGSTRSKPYGSTYKPHDSARLGQSSGASAKGSSFNGGPRRAAGVKRDADGRIERSSVAKSQFKKSQPCPSTGKSTGACPGYVIDHVTPLKRGGPDTPSNMQWQTKAAANAKDKTE